MRMQIKDFAEFVGVSTRTLRYYDEIGLLVPANIDDFTGYRFYDDESLLRMQEIMFYRELDFPLKNIKEIMDSPGYDREEALKDQKELLILKKERMERLILSIDDAIKGRVKMKNFNNTDFDEYKAEVKAKWGNTDAYAEYEEKSKNYSKENYDDISNGMDIIIAEFALNMRAGIEPESMIAKLNVKKLKTYITMNYYTCTLEVLEGLGKMYVADERFKKNIDKHGEGTAEYMSKAIAAYCENPKQL